MRFLVDAQLPRQLCAWLRGAGHDVTHTLDLPQGNRTPDSVILLLAEREQRIVVTKDADFVQSHLIAGRPQKLLLIARETSSTPNWKPCCAAIWPPSSGRWKAGTSSRSVAQP